MHLGRRNVAYRCEVRLALLGVNDIGCMEVGQGYPTRESITYLVTLHFVPSTSMGRLLEAGTVARGKKTRDFEVRIQTRSQDRSVLVVRSSPERDKCAALVQS